MNPAPHLLRVALLFAGVLLWVGCADTVGPDPCLPDRPLASATEGESQAESGDWRAAIDHLVATSPPDSVVKVGVLYHSRPTNEDFALLEELGAVIIHRFKVLSALTIRIAVGNLPVLVQSSRVRLIGLNEPVYPAICPGPRAAFAASVQREAGGGHPPPPGHP